MELEKIVLIFFLILCTVCFAQEVNVSRVVPENYDAQMRPGNPLEGKRKQ